METLSQSDSKVEVKGFEAKHYDFLMNLITFGTYPKFIKNAVDDLNLKPGEDVIDFGCGTGRNACLMLKKIGSNGSITGVEIGKEMKEKFNKNCNFPNVFLLDQRIDESFPVKKKYDLVFTSFVLHGFIQEKREQIIVNAGKILKKGGRFSILDYNEFDVDKVSPFIRFAVRKIECPLAEDFIKRDWKEIMKKHGFGGFEENYYYSKKVRLLTAFL